MYSSENVGHLKLITVQSQNSTVPLQTRVPLQFHWCGRGTLVTINTQTSVPFLQLTYYIRYHAFRSSVFSPTHGVENWNKKLSLPCWLKLSLIGQVQLVHGYWSLVGSLGGGLGLQFEPCMAAVQESTAKIRVLCLWVILLLLMANPTDQLKITMGSFSTRRLLSPSSQSMKLHPNITNTTRQVGASAHEVPSGPNPTSNK